MRFTSRLQFQFRLIPFIATVLVMALGIGLGQWQLQRADTKRAIAVKLAQRVAAPVVDIEQALHDPDTFEFRTVQLTGRFVSEWPLFLDNRPHLGHAGLYVLMPFRTARSGHTMMVQRGWAPRNVQDRTRVPVFSTPAETVVITGQVRKSAGNVMQIGQPAAPVPAAILQNLDLTSLAKASGLTLEPFIVEQTSDTADGLVRDWPLPSSGIDRHLGYAFQWYALTAMAGLFFVVTGFKRAKSANQ